MKNLKYSFPPLTDDNCTILVLGSLPGKTSLNLQQYYAYSQNIFWKMMFEIFEKDFSTDYDIRCNVLLENHIAVWDMIHCAEREGSLDSDIKNESSNDIAQFLDNHPGISKILLNGKKAETAFNKNFKTITIKAFTMPSTSPANAKMNYQEKLEIWKAAIFSK